MAIKAAVKITAALMPVPSPGKHRGEMTLNLSVDNHCVSLKSGSSSGISEQQEFLHVFASVVVASLNDAYATLNIYSSGLAFM